LTDGGYREGWSQQELASRLDTTRANIDYYERRSKNPTLAFIERCAKVFNVPVNELLADAPDIAPQKRGPRSELQKRFDRIESLPKKEQQRIVDVLDVLIDKAG